MHGPRRALVWLRFTVLSQARNAAALAALAAIAAGCWMERPSLGLIVPGVVCFSCLVWQHLRGGSPDA